MRELRLDLDGPEATEALGRALAASLPPRAVVHLCGDLGAGKSTLARALLRHLGVSGSIRSPTYTLVERYPIPQGEAVHLDLYRIADPEELAYLGLDELAERARLWLVEWPERGQGGLPAADLRIDLDLAGQGRSARLRALAEPGNGWLQALETVLQQGLASGGDD